MLLHGERDSGAAKRRRERRLRSWLKHERQTVRMALAEALHHSSGTSPSKRDTRVVEGAKYDALRGQKTVTRAGEGEVREEHHALRGQTRLPPGMRPALLVEVQPQGRVGRHFAEHLAELAPLVQILDAPVPQVVDNVMDAFKFLDQPMTEQVIEVPRISCPPCPSRSQVPVKLTAEQLVEVPTVLSYSLLLQRTAEQTIGIAVPGRGGSARGGLHGLSQGQGSTAVSGADYVGTPVPGRGGGSRGGLHGLSQGQGSTADCGADFVVSPVPGRGGGSRGGLHGLSQGQGSTADCGADFVVSPVPHGRGGGTRGGRHGLSHGQGSTAFGGSENVVSPALHVREGSRGGVQGLSQGQGSSSFSGADNVVSPALHAHGGSRGSRGGLQGSSQGQGSTAVCGADYVVSSASQGRGGGARGGRPGLSQGQGSSAFCEADNVDIPVPHGRVERGLQRFSRGQSSTASAFEQNFSQAPHPLLPRAPVHGRHDEWVCVVDVEQDTEYYWNRWDDTTCWRLPRGVKHRWCRLPSGLYRDVVLEEEFWDLLPL